MTTAALVACDKANPIFNTGPDVSRADLAAEIGMHLRCQFAKYRDIAKYPRFRRSICLKVEPLPHMLIDITCTLICIIS